jgi:hypothetical protein
MRDGVLAGIGSKKRNQFLDGRRRNRRVDRTFGEVAARVTGAKSFIGL